MRGGEAPKNLLRLHFQAQFSTYRDVNEEERLFNGPVDAWIPISRTGINSTYWQNAPQFADAARLSWRPNSEGQEHKSGANDVEIRTVPCVTCVCFDDGAKTIISLGKAALVILCKVSTFSLAG